jgi:FkbM family methyltransferase
MHTFDERPLLMNDHDAQSIPPFKSRLKAALRGIVKKLYGYARPLIRPLAFRARTFFLAGLRDELSQMRHDLVNEIRQGGASPQENRTLMAGMHQAIQASREAILEELAFQDMQLRKALFQEMAVRLDHIEQYAIASARRVAVHGEPGTVLLRSQVGYVVCSDADYAVIAGLLESGELEPGTRQLIERVLAPGDVFVDVGANLGLMSLAAGHAMQGKGKIFAFEPFQQTCAMLARSFWINGLRHMTQIHEAAVSDRNGRATLFLGETSGHHSIFALDETAPASARQIEVDLVALDSVLPSDLAITLIKIDVEGAELDVVRGASGTLQRNENVALIAEFGPSHLRRTGHDVDEWLGVFEKLGYRFRRISEETGALENITRNQLLAAESTNLFFARPTAPVWKKLGIDS